MALRKAASKQAKLKPASSPHAAQPHVRTASGRQRRPTEKENYRGEYYIVVLLYCFSLTCNLTLQSRNLNMLPIAKKSKKRSQKSGRKRH
jgi:hypothetical protein